MLAIFKNTGLKFLALSLLLIIADQFTKLWILNNFVLYEDVNVLPIFDLTYVRNYGAAFSFLSDAGGWQHYFFTSIALVISVLLVYWMYKTPSNKPLLLSSYALILSGALGNVMDRMNYGYVVDFLHFYYQNWHFPAFNVADMAISIGAALLILDAIFEHKKENSTENDSSEQVK
ncbi:lipoprotein signal peptidase [Psychrosphaera saromensis]|uniref:Lipoprotein signal peptidase n=1 Tax=Psychrosphaera saromensis TaxID=716813 RepID=A0A2S7UYD1_9GAMM|nr:signal peptidase II [Psychrosphaera saromensis]PQJ55006.1 signal peptidase II [Psychrosphaera saromensis]GHB55412.1 lipoprotein signal peptidase [Psychrosphaera saromensis]GLQ13736.1 lipoprotein signal peptidase [Psychrosphaera saromensis]